MILNALYLKQRLFSCFLYLKRLCYAYSRCSLASRSQNILDETTKHCKCVAVIVKLWLRFCTFFHHSRVVDVKVLKARFDLMQLSYSYIDVHHRLQ